MTRKIGLVFDIDGVFREGKRIIPCANDSFDLLERNNIPYVFLSNGYGSPAWKAQEMSEIFERDFDAHQFVLSSSPYRSLTVDFKNTPILCIGSHEMCHIVGENVGFKKIVTIQDIAALCPSILPMGSLFPRHPTPERLDEVRKLLIDEPISAIAYINDNYWYPAMQICTDVYRRGGRVLPETFPLSKADNIPLFICNPDLHYASSFPDPRLTQGSFEICLSALIKQTLNIDIKVVKCGKPTRISFDYAGSLLDVDEHWMIGDSSFSDIRGANAIGWKSALVKTGLGKYTDVDALAPEEKPTIVCENVLEAIKTICNLK